MRYATRRLGQSLLTVFSVMTLTFVMIQFLPGGPLGYLRAQIARAGGDPGSVDELAELYINMDPNQPIVPQYIDYMTSVLQGNLGQSFVFNESVSVLLFSALPWTLFVMSLAISLTFVIGLLLGSLMAYHEGTSLDYVGTIVSIFLNSIPYYVFGLLLLFVFAIQLGWFPDSGRLSLGIEPGFTLTFLLDALHHAALPALSFAFTAFGGIAIAMRSNAISVLGEDYLRVARLRGLSSNRISIRYVLPNAVLPMYTSLLLAIGFMFGGTVILEQIYRYPGVGFYIFEGISARDFPLMLGGFLIISISVTLSILFADLTYSFINPKADASGEARSEQSLSGAVRAIKRWINQERDVPDLAAKTGAAAQDVEGSVFETQTGDVAKLTRREQLREGWKQLRAMFAIVWEDTRSKVGIGILLVYLLFGTVGVFLIPAPEVNQAPRFIRPLQDLTHPLGTNNQGTSMLAILVHSIPPLFKMIFAGALVTAIIGALAGMFSGYLGGAVDSVIMTLSDIQIALPGLPLLIVLAVLIEPTNPFLLGIIIAMPRWGGLARNVRSEVLALRNLSYVEANRIIGVGTPSIILADILPNIISYVTVQFVYIARSIIFSVVALYFLGALPVAFENWGVTMNIAYNQGALQTSSLQYWIFEPMLAIIFLVLGLVLTAQGLDRMFNPRIRARHLGKTTEAEPEPETDSGAAKAGIGGD